MKKFLVVLCAVFICTIAIAHTINWHVGDQIISTTTCNSGDNITPPTAPAKRGYHLKNWNPIYVMLEYIESTGTQYIDTGIIPNINTNVKIKAQYTGRFTNSDSWNSLAGSTGGETTANRFYPMGTVGAGENIRQTYGVNQYTQVFDTNIHTIDFNNSDKLVIVDNNLVGFTSSGFTPATTQPSILLFYTNFGASGARWPGKGRVYYFKTYDSDILTRDLIPAKRSVDNAIGMYDTVTNTFFTNQGTGQFIAGPELGGL